MSQLDSLLNLLRDACDIVKQQYAKTSKPLPSLDDEEPHVLDGQFYPVELRKAVRTIEAAAGQLAIIAGRPDHVIANVGAFSPS